MSIAFKNQLKSQLLQIKQEGLYKSERIITNPQGAVIRINSGQEVLNLCANNYLGLSSHPAIIDAAKHTLDTHGHGLSSVRFICGTQDIHKKLEEKISQFLETEDTILYAAAFDAKVHGVWCSHLFYNSYFFAIVVYARQKGFYGFHGFRFF